MFLPGICVGRNGHLLRWKDWKWRGVWPGQSVECAASDLGVTSSSPISDSLLKNKIKINNNNKNKTRTPHQGETNLPPMVLGLGRLMYRTRGGPWFLVQNPVPLTSNDSALVTTGGTKALRQQSWSQDQPQDREPTP